MSSNGTANTSWSTNETRSAGVSEIEDHEQREPHGVAEEGLLLGVTALLRPDDGIRHVGVSSDASPRVLRARSMLRQTRPTTVVSHARRLSTSLVSVRLRRIHVSWTASSASVTEPSIRKATPRRCRRLASNRSASQALSSMGRSLARIGFIEETLPTAGT